MSSRAKSVESRGLNRVFRSRQASSRSRHRVLGDAVKPLIENLESRQLLSVTGLGVNFTGGGNGNSVAMNSTDTAGVFPIANYNNENGGTQTAVTGLTDSTGAVSPITMTYTSGGTWNSTPNAPATGDQELNNGFLFSGGSGTPVDVQLTGIPYANYDVYVYELNDGAGRLQQTTDVTSGAVVFGTSANPTDANHISGVANNYQYVAATGTTAATATPNADFVVFSGSTANFEFSAFSAQNGYVNGFEIVDHTTTAPTLTAATPGNNAVGLAWNYGNSQANNFTYTIFRSDAAHPAAAIATGVTAQTYNDLTAVNGTAYTYYVVANNSVGPSANSNSLSATPFAGAPQPPTGIAASRTNATTVAISWNPSLGAGSYDLQRGTALNANGTLGGTITDITPGGTTQTSATDASALPDGYYAVTATNAAGTSAPSNVVFVNHGDGWQASYYSSDTANTNVYDGDQTAGVAFTQPDGTPVPATVTQPPTTNNPPVNNAVLGFQRNEATPIHDVNFNNTTPPPNAPSNFNTIEGGNPGQDFAVRWVGYVEPQYTGYYTLNPNSDDGVAVTVFDTKNLTNGQPTPVTLQPDNLFLGRGANTDSDPVVDSTGAPVQWIAGQKYLVQMDYNQGGGGWQAVLSDSASSTVANQTAGTYDVQPQKLIPLSQVIAPIPTFKTVDAANPGGLAKDNSYYTISTQTGPGEVQLTFSNIGADSYNIYRSTSPTGPFTTPIANVPETNGQAVTYIDTGLTNGTTYYYVVTGVDLAGETPIASGLTTSAKPAATAPAAPTNLQATRVDANNVALTWNSSLFATSYDVKRGTVLNADGTLGGTITDVTPGGTTNTSATDTNAFQRTTYYYQVTASDAGGTSGPSNTATVNATYSLVQNPFAVNFIGGSNGGGASVTLSAGVVPTTAWNNEAGASGTGTITAADGSTTASLTYSASGTWNDGTSTATGNGQLLNGYLDEGQNAGGSSVTISGLTGSAYDVYVYTEGDGANRASNYVINGVDNMVDETPPTRNSTALILDPSDPTLAGGPGGTYLVNTSVAPASGAITITANTDGEFRSPINGIELVPHYSAAPTAAPVLSPATAGDGTVSLSYTSVPNASSYTVYRSDPAHTTPVIVATNIPTTTYTDNTVTNGVTYTYTVSGDNAVGAGPQSNAVSATPTGVTATPVSVSSVTVNGNNAALSGVQRSMVNGIVYTFNQAVKLGANAFTLAIHSGQTGTVPTVAYTAINPDAGGGSTQWLVSFSGAGVSGGSIGDGVYDITLNSTAVSSEASPTATVTPRATDTFYRLFGDAQGTAKVNSADYTAFLSTYGLKSTAPGYLAYFADDGTGKIDAADYNAFLGNFGKKLSGFTATI